MKIVFIFPTPSISIRRDIGTMRRPRLTRPDDGNRNLSTGFRPNSAIVRPREANRCVLCDKLWKVWSSFHEPLGRKEEPDMATRYESEDNYPSVIVEIPKDLEIVLTRSRHCRRSMTPTPWPTTKRAPQPERRSLPTAPLERRNLRTQSNPTRRRSAFAESGEGREQRKRSSWITKMYISRDGAREGPATASDDVASEVKEDPFRRHDQDPKSEAKKWDQKHVSSYRRTEERSLTPWNIQHNRKKKTTPAEMNKEVATMPKKAAAVLAARLRPSVPQVRRLSPPLVDCRERLKMLETSTKAPTFVTHVITRRIEELLDMESLASVKKMLK